MSKTHDSDELMPTLGIGTPNSSFLSQSENKKPEPELDVPTSAERFWVLFIFGCCTMMNACGWISLSPLGPLMEEVYDVGPTVTMMMSYVFMMLYLPVNFPSVWVVDKWGLRAGTLMGIGFTTAGYWLRCLINVNFYTCLIG